MRASALSASKLRRVAVAAGIKNASKLAEEAEVPLHTAISVFSSTERITAAREHVSRLLEYLDVDYEDVRYGSPSAAERARNARQCAARRRYLGQMPVVVG